jgi:N-acetylglutamate synthase-like GNAT family acetyltransferase
VLWAIRTFDGTSLVKRPARLHVGWLTSTSGWPVNRQQHFVDDQLLQALRKSSRRLLHSWAVSSFFIRCAVISEQGELEALQLRASLTNAGDRDALLAHPDAIELPIDQIAAGAVFVSERNGAIVGFAALLPRPDGDVELDALFVDADIRRCGVGRSLVDHCVQITRTQGSAALCVIGNPHAYDFYGACGFKIVGTTETRFGPGLLMRKTV